MRVERLRGRLRVAVRPEQRDPDRAGVEPLRVRADDVPLDAAVAALEHLPVLVDEKVVADVVPAVALHVVDLDPAHDRRRLRRRVRVRRRRCGGRPRTGRLREERRAARGSPRSRPTPRAAMIARRAGDRERPRRHRLHGALHEAARAVASRGRAAGTGSRSDGPTQYGLPSFQPQRRASLGRARVGHVVGSGLAAPPRGPAAARRARAEVDVPGPRQCRPTRSKTGGRAAASARPSPSGTSRVTSVTSSANAEAGNASATTMTASSFTGRGPRVANRTLRRRVARPLPDRILTSEKRLLCGAFFSCSSSRAPRSLPQARQPRPAARVLAIEFDNDVNPVTQDYVEQQIDRADEEDYDAVVILLDTPGGLVSSMEDIVKAELASTVPVIVYVSPEGASATSAGVFIAQAGDLLAMAPQTKIGSSTPVGVGRREPARRPAREGGQEALGAAPRARQATTAATRTWASGRCAAATAGRPRRPLDQNVDRRDRARPPHAPERGRRAHDEAEGPRPRTPRTREVDTRRAWASGSRSSTC